MKIPWRREKLPTPVFWPGEFHGLYSPWRCKELDTTERLSIQFKHDLACWDEYTPFYFLEIDYKNNILTSLCGGDNDYNYIVEDNKVYVNEKYTGDLGFPAYGTYGEVDCKEPTKNGHKFDYFELLDGTSQINELKLKRALMFNSYEKEYEKQIEFAKSLKSLEIFITNHKKQ